MPCNQSAPTPSHSASPFTSPPHPRVGVSALVQRDDKILVVRRRNAPNQGQLAFPGGKLHWGEPLMQGVARELKEETGIVASVDRLLEAVDVFLTNEHEQITQHFVVLCYLCHWQQGQARANDDAEAVYWLSAQELLQRNDISAGVRQVLRGLSNINDQKY